MRLERTPDKREVGSSTLPRPTTRTELGSRWSEEGSFRSAFGGVAQLGERLPCTQEVIGSNPFTSTRSWAGLAGFMGEEFVGRVKLAFELV